MGLRSGTASVWERVCWGVAGGAFGFGVWSSLYARSLREKTEELFEGAELSELQSAVERALCLMDRSSAWWWVAVICGWLAAVSVSVALWKRKSRLEAAPPKASAPDEECVVQTGNE